MPTFSPSYEIEYNKLKKKLDDFVRSKNLDFDTKCFLTFKTRPKDPTNPIGDKIIVGMHFCLNDDRKTQQFKEKLQEYYTKTISDSEDFLSLQQLDKIDNNYFQYYDSNYPGEIANYDTKFDKEGMLMSKDSSKKMTLVKYSFRYDELLSCKPILFKDFSKSIDEKSKKAMKPESCCSAYAVSWGLFVSKVSFCSLLPEDCNIHAKFFKSTFYKKCFESNLLRLNDALRKLEQGTGAPLSLKDMAQLLNLLKDLKEKDLAKFYDPNSLIGKQIQELANKADDLKKELLPELFDQLNKGENKNGENSLFGYNSNANGGENGLGGPGANGGENGLNGPGANGVADGNGTTRGYGKGDENTLINSKGGKNGSNLSNKENMLAGQNGRLGKGTSGQGLNSK